jgi:hypothetical protein
VETPGEDLRRREIFQDRQRDIRRWSLNELAAGLGRAIDEARRFEIDFVAQERPRGRWEERQALERVRHGLAVLDTELTLKPSTLVTPDTTVQEAISILGRRGTEHITRPRDGRGQCDGDQHGGSRNGWLAVWGSLGEPAASSGPPGADPLTAGHPAGCRTTAGIQPAACGRRTRIQAGAIRTPLSSSEMVR